MTILIFAAAAAAASATASPLTTMSVICLFLQDRQRPNCQIFFRVYIDSEFRVDQSQFEAQI